MGIKRANVIRKIDEEHELQIDACKGGWEVRLIRTQSNEGFVSGPHKHQLDGVIHVLKRFYGEHNET